MDVKVVDAYDVWLAALASRTPGKIAEAKQDAQGARLEVCGVVVAYYSAADFAMAESVEGKINAAYEKGIGDSYAGGKMGRDVTSAA